MNILITAALQSEIKLFLNYLQAGKIFESKKMPLYRSIKNGHRFFIGITGVGPRNIKKFAGLIKDKNIVCDIWISTGFAGSLDSRLKAGDIVIGDKFIHSPGIEKKIMLPDVLKNFPSRYSYQTAQVYSSREFLDREKKNGIMKKYPSAGFADMESIEISNAAVSLGMPLLIMRSITDEPDFDFPPPEFIRDSLWKINWLDFIKQGIRRPSVFYSFFRLLKRIIKAGKSLYSGLKNLTGDIPYEN